MSRHYTFHDNKVTEHKQWGTVAMQPKGAIFYSPFDDFPYQWGMITDVPGHGWRDISFGEAPKEFLTQLLLMGVPC